MAQVERIRCPLCGLTSTLKRFGILPEGYDPETAPAHDLILRVDTIGGRGRLTVEHHPLPLETARELRAAMAAALERLDAEINGAAET